jgi:hypothetical protein
LLSDSGRGILFLLFLLFFLLFFLLNFFLEILVNVRQILDKLGRLQIVIGGRALRATRAVSLAKFEKSFVGD